MTLEHENRLASRTPSLQSTYPLSTLLRGLPYPRVLDRPFWEMAGPKLGFLSQCNGRAKMRRTEFKQANCAMACENPQENHVVPF